MWDFDLGTCPNGQLADYLEQVVAHRAIGCGDEVREAARRLRNAVAPELYEALREMLERNHHCSACPHDKDGDCNGCVGERAHDALRKAAGESGVRHD